MFAVILNTLFICTPVDIKQLRRSERRRSKRASNRQHHCGPSFLEHFIFIHLARWCLILVLVGRYLACFTFLCSSGGLRPQKPVSHSFIEIRCVKAGKTCRTVALQERGLWNGRKYCLMSPAGNLPCRVKMGMKNVKRIHD